MAGKRGDHPDDLRIRDCIKRAGVGSAEQLANKAGLSPTLLHTRLANTERSRVSVPTWEKIEAVCLPPERFGPTIRVPVVFREHLEAWLKMNKAQNPPEPLETLAYDPPSGYPHEMVCVKIHAAMRNTRFNEDHMAVIGIGDTDLIDGKMYIIALTPAAVLIHKLFRDDNISGRSWEEASGQWVASWAPSLPPILPSEVVAVIGRVLSYIIEG